MRELDLERSTISTVHIGEPFITLTSVCISSPHKLLLSDRGAGCIWSLEVINGNIEKLVCVIDLPVSTPLNPKSESHVENTLPFRPLCISKVDDGVFAFSDLSRNQIFRYLERDTVIKAVNDIDHSQAFSNCNDALQNFEISVSNCLRSIRRGLADFRESVGQLYHISKNYLNQNYIAEANRMKTSIRNDASSISTESIVGMILNAPSIAGLNSFLKLVDIHPEFVAAAKDAISKFMKEYNFSVGACVDDTEIFSLGDIFRYCRESLAGQDLMCAILNNDEFSLNLTSATLTMLGGVLQRLNWTMDRQKVPDLRREVVRWLRRCLPTDAVLGWMEYTHEQVLIGSLRSWSAIMRQFDDENNYVKKVLHWVVRVHVDSLCMGFVNTSLTAKADVDPVYDLYSQTLPNLKLIPNDAIVADGLQKNVDRALLTLRSLPYVFNNTYELQYDLLAIFSDTVSDVARTLNVETAVKALLQSAIAWTVSCTTNLNNVAPLVKSDSSDVCPFSYVLQHVLFDMVYKHFLLLESKIGERMTMQYNKAKSNPNIPLERIMELENKVNKPPSWEFQVEIISFEPFLWAHFLYWQFAEVFELSRSLTPWSFDMQRYHRRLSTIFSELSENVTRGHVSTDILRKIHSHGDALIPGFLAVGSLLGNDAYLKSLELEFQSAWGEVEMLTKVSVIVRIFIILFRPKWNFGRCWP